MKIPEEFNNRQKTKIKTKREKSLSNVACKTVDNA